MISMARNHDRGCRRRGRFGVNCAAMWDMDTTTRRVAWTLYAATVLFFFGPSVWGAILLGFCFAGCSEFDRLAFK
jgi:hypothetical protein